MIDNIQQYAKNQRADLRKTWCDDTYQTTSPLALDFSGKGFLPTEQDKGFSFDLDADGEPEQMSSLGAQAGILSLDLNNNGAIDDGRELFGDKTILQSLTGLMQEAVNGFLALAQYDANGDGKITADDPIFDRLKVWVDDRANGGDGMSQKTLREVGVQELDLNSTADHEIDIFGNEAREVSSYLDSSGARNYLVDIWFLTISHSKK